MTARQLTAAERRQRREAAVTHGALAQAKNAPVIEGRWRRLRRALNKRGVRVTAISPKAWLELRLLVRYLTLIELADAHLWSQQDALKDPLVDKYTSWLSQAAAIVARLPVSLASAVEDDLGALLRRK